MAESNMIHTPRSDARSATSASSAMSTSSTASEPTQFIIRRATLMDSAFLAKCTLLAERAHLPTSCWDLRYGDHALDLLTKCFQVQNSSFLSHDSWLVAETVGPEPVLLAGICTYVSTARSVGAALKLMDTQAGREFNITRQELARRWEKADGLMEDLYVIPEARRLGLGAALMHAALWWGRECGCTCAQLVVYDGNEGAFALYKRLGFQVQSSPKSARFFAQYGSTGSRVMRFTRLDDYAAPEPHIPEVEVAALRRSAAVMRDSLDEDAPP